MEIGKWNTKSAIRESNLVWIDCEMTGLDPKTNHLIEIAVIVTDKDLNILAEGPNLVIHQTDEVCQCLNICSDLLNPIFSDTKCHGRVVH